MTWFLTHSAAKANFNDSKSRSTKKNNTLRGTVWYPLTVWHVFSSDDFPVFHAMKIWTTRSDLRRNTWRSLRIRGPYIAAQIYWTNISGVLPIQKYIYIKYIKYICNMNIYNINHIKYQQIHETSLVGGFEWRMRSSGWITVYKASMWGETTYSTCSNLKDPKKHWLLQPKTYFIIGVIVFIFAGLVLTPTGLIIWHQPQTMHFEEQIPSKLIINPSKMSISKNPWTNLFTYEKPNFVHLILFPLCLAEIQRIDVSCGCRHLKPAISWRMDWNPNIAMEDPPFVNEFPMRKGHFPANYVRFTGVVFFDPLGGSSQDL